MDPLLLQKKLLSQIPAIKTRKPPKPGATPGIAGAWKAQPRRRCVNCGKRYQPFRPEQRFCRDAVKDDPNYCRNQFKRYGGAYHRVLTVIERKVCEATVALDARVSVLEKYLLARRAR